MNQKRTIACWSHLLMTYPSEKIPWNFHTSLRSHLKNSCFGFHQAFQIPQNNKSTRPKQPRAFICFSVFGTPDKILALVVDILRQGLCHIQWVKYHQQRGVQKQAKWHLGNQTSPVKNFERQIFAGFSYGKLQFGYRDLSLRPFKSHPGNCAEM